MSGDSRWFRDWRIWKRKIFVSLFPRTWEFLHTLWQSAGYFFVITAEMIINRFSWLIYSSIMNRIMLMHSDTSMMLSNIFLSSPCMKCLRVCWTAMTEQVYQTFLQWLKTRMSLSVFPESWICLFVKTWLRIAAGTIKPMEIICRISTEMGCQICKLYIKDTILSQESCPILMMPYWILGISYWLIISL